MKYETKKITLKDGREAILRTPRIEDARELLEYMRTTAAETDFILRTAAECGEITADAIRAEEGFIAHVTGSPNDLMLLCEVDGELAGNCHLLLFGKSKIRHRGSVAIALKKKFWNLGIGTEMFTEMKRTAKEHGTEQLELEYIEGNERGRRLYEKAGFVQYAVRPDAIRLTDGTSLSEILMLCRL